MPQHLFLCSFFSLSWLIYIDSNPYKIYFAYPTDCEENRKVIDFDDIDSGAITVSAAPNMQDPIADIFDGSDEPNPIGPTDDGPLTFTIDLGEPGTSQLMGLRFNGENIDTVQVTAVEDAPTPQQKTEVSPLQHLLIQLTYM